MEKKRPRAQEKGNPAPKKHPPKAKIVQVKTSIPDDSGSERLGEDYACTSRRREGEDAGGRQSRRGASYKRIGRRDELRKKANIEGGPHGKIAEQDHISSSLDTRIAQTFTM